MLLVKTKIGASRIHRFGLFADEFIPVGTHIWQFTPGFDLEMTKWLYDILPLDSKKFIEHFGYFDHRLERYIMAADNACFINHSTNPNIFSNTHLDRYGVDIAVRDIEIGEEITIDYSTIEKK